MQKIKKFLFCSTQKRIFRSSQIWASPQTHWPTRGAGRKSEPDIKLRGGPTRPALCGPKCGAGQNRPGWPALPSVRGSSRGLKKRKVILSLYMNTFLKSYIFKNLC